MSTARTHIHSVSARSLGTPPSRLAEPHPEGYVPIAVDADGNLVGGVQGEGTFEHRSAEGGYDPGDHTVDDVKEYVEANPEQAEAIFDAEVDGKDRTTLTDWLSNLISGDE